MALYKKRTINYVGLGEVRWLTKTEKHDLMPDIVSLDGMYNPITKSAYHLQRFFECVIVPLFYVIFILVTSTSILYDLHMINKYLGIN